MPTDRPPGHRLPNPFADLIALAIDEQRSGYSRLSLQLAPEHMNLHGVAHGAVVFAMADTGMGTALYPTLDKGQICATIEIKVNYFKPVLRGRLVCVTELLNRGKRVANLDSRVYLDDQLVAQANGNYAIFSPSDAARRAAGHA